MSAHDWITIDKKMMTWDVDHVWRQCRGCGAARRVQVATGEPEMVLDEWRLGVKTGGLKKCPTPVQSEPPQRQGVATDGDSGT